MPTVNSLPNGASFGTQFDYSVWGPGTEVTLCNVPWDSMYRDVYWFDSPERTIAYIRSFDETRNLPTVSIKNLTYCAQGVPVRISIPFSEANTFNYLIVQNSSFPISQKNRATTFFYFIQSVDYVAPETTQLTISLDVWQTYHSMVKFGSAFIERSHCLEYRQKRVIEKGDGDAGSIFSRMWLKQPESFSLGERHTIYRSWFGNINSEKVNSFNEQFDFVAVIISTINLDSDFGTTGNPSMYTATGSNVKTLVPHLETTGQAVSVNNVSGATYYMCDIKNLPNIMKELSAAPWVSQGILDIYYVPKRLLIGNQISGKLGSQGLMKVDTAYARKVVEVAYNFMPNKLPDFLKENGNTVGRKNLKRLKRFLKFYTSPYMYLEVSFNNGQTLALAPELLNDWNAVRINMECHVLPPSPRLVGYVRGYNTDKHDSSWKTDTEYVNEAVVIDNFPHLPVVNDQSMIWYASHAHSIAQSRTAASWGLDKSTRAADTSFDATMRGIRAGNAIMNNNLGAQNLNTALANTAQMAHQQVNSANRAISGIGGAVSTALTNPLGGIGQLGGYVQGQVTSDISTAIDINARNMGNVISQNLTRANQSEQNMLTGTNAAANRDLAKWASQGDYQQQIAAINASVKDAQITPPSVSGASGGDAFNWIMNGAVIFCKLKMVSTDVIRRQGQFWERYGYACDFFLSNLPDKLRVMDRFSYWKCKDVRIYSSACPQTYVDTLRGILEKGVTVWHSPMYREEKFGDVSLDNAPINWDLEGDYL
nr:MAG TPA: Major tail protein [Caudoviricetes sp.]